MIKKKIICMYLIIIIICNPNIPAAAVDPGKIEKLGRDSGSGIRDGIRDSGWDYGF